MCVTVVPARPLNTDRLTARRRLFRQADTGGHGVRLQLHQRLLN